MADLGMWFLEEHRIPGPKTDEGIPTEKKTK